MTVNHVSKTRIVLGCSINVGSSVLIVLVNKYIYTHYGFPNMALTCIHFILTFFGLVLCKMLNIFEVKKLPILAMIPLSLTFCGFVVLTNLSLQYNTVGTYQIIKVLTMPIVMFISYFFYSKLYSFQVISTLVSAFLSIKLYYIFHLYLFIHRCLFHLVFTLTLIMISNLALLESLLHLLVL